MPDLNDLVVAVVEAARHALSRVQQPHTAPGTITSIVSSTIVAVKMDDSPTRNLDVSLAGHTASVGARVMVHFHTEGAVYITEVLA
jgi:hypothetical protein